MLNEVLKLTKGEVKTSTKLKLDKCIFCESEKVAVIANLSSDKSGKIKNWYVECQKCFAQGSKTKNTNENGNRT